MAEVLGNLLGNRDITPFSVKQIFVLQERDQLIEEIPNEIIVGSAQRYVPIRIEDVSVISLHVEEHGDIVLFQRAQYLAGQRQHRVGLPRSRAPEEEKPHA